MENQPDTTEQQSNERPLERARWALAAMVLGSAVGYGLLWEVPFAIQAFYLVGVLTALVVRSALGTLALVVGVLILDTLQRIGPGLSDYRLGTGDVASAAFLLLYLAFGLRYAELGRPAAAGSEIGPVAAGRFNPLGAGSYLVPLALALALAALWFLPLRPAEERIAELPATVARAVALFWALGFALLLVAPLLDLMRLRRMTARQARYELQRVAAEELASELGLLQRAARRRLK